MITPLDWSASAFSYSRNNEVLTADRPPTIALTKIEALLWLFPAPHRVPAGRREWSMMRGMMMLAEEALKHTELRLRKHAARMRFQLVSAAND